MIPLPDIRRALASSPATPPAPSRSMAAVAMAFAGDPQALSLCFILRAEREGDRWSGQMAFPGGKAEPDDPTAEAVAIRETHEEVGLRLDQAESLGGLEPVSLRPAGGKLGVLSPFAFYVGREPPSLHPNAGEVANAWWIPLAHLWDESQRTTVEWEYQGRMLRLPGIRFGEHVIWGLTLRVLSEWSQQQGRPLPITRAKPRLRG